MNINNENFQKVRSKLTTVLFQDDNESQLKNGSNQQETKSLLMKSIQHGDFSAKKNSFLKEYELGKTLGQGAHAIVKLCWPKNQQQILFAVKITRSSDPEIMDNMKQTFLNTVQLTHANIIKHYKLYIDQNQETAYMLMDYCSFPSLEKILKEKKRIFESSAMKLFRSLVEAVDFIHSKGICHRDIKPDNILVNQSDLSIRLTDFGVSKRFKYASQGKFFWQESSMWTVTGNVYYCAPEIFHQGGYNQAIDIWSIGVVLYQSLCSSLPYTPEQLRDYIDYLKEDPAFMNPMFKQLSPLCQDLIKRMLKPSPELRLTAKNVLLHPWFQRIDENSKTVARDDLQFSSQDEKKLAFSEQFKQGNSKKFSKLQPTYDVIEERNDDCTPYTNTEHLKNVKNFKENNQLDNIHMVVRDSSQIPQIDFIASYHSTSLGKQQHIENENIEEIIQQDPFFAEAGQMMVCDSDQSFDEEDGKEISLKNEQDRKELE